MTSSTWTADGAQVDKHIDRLVAEAPPLSPEQRDKLAVLLRPGCTEGMKQGVLDAAAS